MLGSVVYYTMVLSVVTQFLSHFGAKAAAFSQICDSFHAVFMFQSQVINHRHGFSSTFLNLLWFCSGILIRTLADASSERRTLSAPQIVFTLFGFCAAVVATVIITVYAKRQLKVMQDEPLLAQLLQVLNQREAIFHIPSLSEIALNDLSAMKLYITCNFIHRTCYCSPALTTIQQLQTTWKQDRHLTSQ